MHELTAEMLKSELGPTLLSTCGVSILWCLFVLFFLASLVHVALQHGAYIFTAPTTHTHTHSFLVISLSLKAFICRLRHIALAKISLLLFRLVLDILNLKLTLAVILWHDCLTKMPSVYFHGRSAGKDGGEETRDEKMIKNIVCVSS